jgi:glycosyltransferase involved in cell wall biosynthesis
LLAHKIWRGSLRILLAHSFYRIPGGEDRYVTHQAKLLAQRHEVDLLGARNTDLPSGVRTAGRMTFSSSMVQQLEIRIRQFRPDVIHLHNPYPALGPSVHLAARRQGIPMVMTVHNLRLRCPNGLMYTEGELCRRCETGNYVNAMLHACFPSRSQAGAYAAALWMHRFVMRLQDIVDVFIAPSEFMHERLHGWGIPKDRACIVRNFVSLNPSPMLNVGTFGLYVGRLSVEKGVDVLLRALAACGDPPFHIVGDGPLKDDLIALAGRLRLRGTEFTGRLSPAEVLERMSTARYLVMPSLCDENAPLAVMEAMSLGRPVVLSKRGGLPELIVRGGGLLTEAGDADDLAQHIASLSIDDGLCNVLGGQALTSAQRYFSPMAHLTRLERIYQRIASQGARTGT